MSRMLRPMSQMQAIVTDVRGVCLSVCPSVTRFNSASELCKSAEPVQIIVCGEQ